MKNDSIISMQSLGFLYPVGDPFLFCAHHLDNYPEGNEEMGPAVSLSGRNLGQDFTIKDGWRMYHGETIPGFPVHPHRGFETVTIVLEGFVDHSDSHGQAGRYGEGDVQWMTAGSGLQHSEMFPLLKQNEKNPLELFQVWINLPSKRKFAEPHFKMLWSEDISVYKSRDKNGKLTTANVIAGALGDKVAPAPTPDSWAAEEENKVLILTVKMDVGAEWTLPGTEKDIERSLYFYRGSSIFIENTEVKNYNAVKLKSNEDVVIINGDTDGYLLLLQGKPIKEPVVQYGPFVMNTEDEIRQAFSDYRRTQFGGWHWERPDNVHPQEKGRFAKHRDGSIEEK